MAFMTDKQAEIRKHIVDTATLLFLFFFLLSYFEPHLLFSSSITTGGDTGSHYYTAQYVKDVLLPKGKISGWCQGNLAGFPILQNYFPLPFFLMAALSWLIPLQIAFKLVTVLGIFLLPFCTYLFFRFLRLPFPVPVIGAVFSVAFLFMDGNSMWGGNIPSTLAGTFCYSLGFAIAVLWIGLLYRTIYEDRSFVTPAFLLAATGLCHGYTLLFAVFASCFFLFTKQHFSHHLKILLKVHITAFLLMGFWLIPLMAFLRFTTRFSIYWIFFDWKQILREIFPVIIWPFIGLFLLGSFWVIVRKLRSPPKVDLMQWSYLIFMVLCGLGLYMAGYRIGVVDIRFLPFFQFFLVIGGAMLFSLIPTDLKAGIVLAGLVLISTCLWVDNRETFIGDWIKSNYAGFENKRLWGPFSQVNAYLKGTPQDPRVAYEHSMLHEGAGTVRAFENIPLFSGRSTLEGVYIQASLPVPFIFYIQSEISQKASMPIPDYCYSRFDLIRGSEHLRLFNVRDIVAVEPETKKALKRSPYYQSRFRAGPYEVYELLTNPNRYVEPVRNIPMLITKGGWRRVFYKWFRLGDLTIPIVYKENPQEKDRDRFHPMESFDETKLPKTPIETTVPLKETIREEEILIDGAEIGKPLLIKISFHPNWQVEGAKEIYLVSPGFMLIYPDAPQIRLYYGKTWPDYVGAASTCLIIFILLVFRFCRLQNLRKYLTIWFDKVVVKTVLITGTLFLIATTYYFLNVSREYPVLSYNKGIQHFTDDNLEKAREHFRDVLMRFPQTLVVDQAAFHYAICFYKEKEWDEAIGAFKSLLDTYPDSGRAAETRYHLGLCYLHSGRIAKAREEFARTIEQFPEGIWSGFARDRLKEFDS